MSPALLNLVGKHLLSASPGFAPRKESQCDTAHHPYTAAQQSDFFLTNYPELALFILRL